MALVLAALLAPTIQGPADVEALTSSADAVVHGKVLGLRSHPGSQGGLIFTEVSIAPICWGEDGGGVPPSGWCKAAGGVQPIAVRVEGGIVGDIGQSVAGAPSFTPGDEVVVFLRRI